MSRRARFCLDLLAATVSVYTMVAATPVGGLVRSALRRATGGRVSERPLVSYFRTETEAGGAASGLASASGGAPVEDPLAARAGLDPRLARAIALVAAEGRVAADGTPDARIPPAGQLALRAIGARVPPEGASATESRLALYAGVIALRAHLGSDEAALAALAADLDEVRYALERARAAGVEHSSRFEAFGPFLSPDARAAAARVVGGTLALHAAYGMLPPIDGGARVTSRFGYRIHPVLGHRKLHTGVDLGVPTGTEVRASAAGRVVYAARDSVNGNFVKLDHGHGLTSAYCHASRLDVRAGDQVPPGAIIALSGATGRATGPHLHFQVELDGEPVDPELFINTLAEVASAVDVVRGTDRR